MFEGVSNFLDKVSDVLWRYWKLKLVRDPPINILLKEGEEGKVEPCAFGVKTLNRKEFHQISIKLSYIDTHIFNLLIF